MPRHHSGYDDLPESILRRFRRYTGPANGGGCILWTGPSSKHGYGHIFRRTKDGHQRGYFAHRIAWILAHGPVPDDLDVLHECDNPPCINPKHLFLGTFEDNMRDMRSKNRHTKGESCSLTKLTEDVVRKIRRLHATGKYTLKRLGDSCGTSYTNVWMIVNRRSWKHI